MIAGGIIDSSGNPGAYISWAHDATVGITHDNLN